MKTLTLVVLSLLILPVFACGSSGEDVALEAAKKWSSDSVSRISEEIGQAVGGEIDILGDIAASVIEDQIRDNVQWSYSTPSEISANRFSLTATASVDIEIDLPLIPAKNYRTSVDYRLEADTDQERVVNSNIELSTLRIQEQ